MTSSIDIFLYKPLYLKWENQVIGIINEDFSVTLKDTTFNPIISIYFKILDNGKNSIISRADFKNFLADRMISQNRKDIRTILARMQMVEYDLFEIAKKTRAFNIQDKLWISYSLNEDYTTTFRSVFIEFFNNKINARGDSISSPSGQNVKSYIFRNDNRYGIAKEPLHPYSSDTMNEVVAYRLGKLLNVNCCFAEMITKTTVFSEYEYDFVSNSMIHARYFLNGNTLSLDNYEQIINDQFKEEEIDILKMILFDFIINQDDRHPSNWSFQFDANGKRKMYSLYDNGRSLFYDSTEESIKEALEHPEIYSNSFGLVGTYYDVISDIKGKHDVNSLINLNVTEKQIRDCFLIENYPEWKIDYVVKWIRWALGILK